MSKYEYLLMKIDLLKDLVHKQKYSILSLANNSEELFGLKMSTSIIDKVCQEYNITHKKKRTGELCRYCGRSKKNDHFCKEMIQQKPLEEHETLIRDLLKKDYSIYEMTNNSKSLFGFEIAGHTLRSFCKRNNIRLKNIKERMNSDRVKEKRCAYNIERYGYENPSSSDEIKEKRKNTFEERYGVVNPFQLNDVKEKSKETLMLKYGVENSIHIQGRKKPNNFSKPHQKISSYLTSKNIEHINEKTGLFKKYSEYHKRIYSPIVDIFVPESNLVIEIFGNHWHCNPKIYHATDMFHFWDGYFSADQVWTKDKARKEHIESFGVKYLVFWEDNINHCFNDVCQQLTAEW